MRFRELPKREHASGIRIPARGISGAAIAALAGTSLLLAPSTARAQQFTYPGCSDLQSSEFSKTELFNRSGAFGATQRSTLREPVAFDLHGFMNGDSVARVDAYVVERLGNVLHYNGSTRAVSQIGSISVAGVDDNGLMGIALDPGFFQNRWIYLWYVPPRVGTNNYRGVLARFTLTGANTIDMASRKELINVVLSKTTQWHSGGPMQFDRHGDLWVTLGNNSTDHHTVGTGVNPYNHFSRTDSTTSDEWGASNTANLRGGIFRIRPDDTATTVVAPPSGTYGPGYTIPAGNFGEHWADYFQSKGNTARAAEYRDPAKVLPEVYVKGERSNHSIAVHPRHRWIGWGTVNFETNRDELNLITNPAFTGYPYFHGQADHASLTRTAGQQQILGYLVDSLNPRNASPFNSGVEYLPPVTWPARAYNSGVVPNVIIGGPFYWYDRNLKSPRKFPPHLHNTWLAFGQTNNQAHMHAIDSTTVTITASRRVDAAASGIFVNVGAMRGTIQGKYGPDGALYLLYYGGGHYSATPDNNPGLVRVDYNGACHLPAVALRPDVRTNPDDLAVRLRAGGILVREPGGHVVTLRTLSGTLVGRRNGEGSREYTLADLNGGARPEAGAYVVTVRTDRGSFVRQVTVF